MEMQINVVFTVTEVNLVLAALAQRPWAEVAGLMEKIKAEGEAQIAKASLMPAAYSEEK